MPQVHFYSAQWHAQKHTDEIQDIITAPPTWLLRWGVTLLFGFLVLLISLSAFIRYPDIVKTRLKINSYNSPKLIITKIPGKLVKILIHEKQMVTSGQTLAYLESTAKHNEVLQLEKALKKVQRQFFNKQLESKSSFNTPVELQLGELQSAYQSFYQSYLAYKSSTEDGFYLKKKLFLQHDLSSILRQKEQLLAQQVLQEKDYSLTRQEYEVHQVLSEQKVEAPLDLKREEGKLIAKEYPLQGTKASLIQNAATYSAKERDIVELENQIKEEKLKFAQALNTLISGIEDWKSKYVLSACQSGRAALSGIIQENQFLNANQEVFYIDPVNSSFFGEMDIQQYHMGKVAEGQKVIIKLRSYPYEEYGVLWGRLEYVSEIPLKDSVFISRVSFKDHNLLKMRRPIKLKNGMLADAEIITEDASLLARLIESVKKVMQ